MLEYSSPCDKYEVDRVHDLIQTSSSQLSQLEAKYNIKNFNQSKNIKNYPQHERGNVLKLWSEVYQGAMEFDFLFIDEDLYPSSY